jgi:hypothetical protein
MHIIDSLFEFTTDVGAHLAPPPQCSAEDSSWVQDAAPTTKNPLIATDSPTRRTLASCMQTLALSTARSTLLCLSRCLLPGFGQASEGPLG